MTNVNTQIGTTDTITLGVDEHNDTVDAGAYKLVSLGNKVWQDSDNNGIQDAGEDGISGITLKLLDSNGDPVDDPNNPGNPYEVTTDANGEYLFENLIPGTYVVEVVTPAGYILSDKNEGSDTTVDSDFDPATKRTDEILLGSGDEDITYDAGLYMTLSIGDKV